MNQTMLYLDFGIMFLAFIVLFRGLHFTMRLRTKTKKVTPLWLFIQAGVMLLMLYSLAAIISFGAYIVLGESEPTAWVEDTMDMLKLVLSTAAACFLTAAGLLLKNSPVKPI
jgi:hypothetical protein